MRGSGDSDGSDDTDDAADMEEAEGGRWPIGPPVPGPRCVTAIMRRFSEGGGGVTFRSTWTRIDEATDT